MPRQVEDAYVVAALRTPVGKIRGMFKHTRPDDLLVHCIHGVLDQVPNLDPARIQDAVIGNAMPEGEQGMNMARIAVLLAGLPDCVSAVTVNRFCASGLQAVAYAADRIRLGEADVMLAGGTESMTMVPMMGNKMAINRRVFEKDENYAIAYGMGITAEKVAERWKISREQQDAYAVVSNTRAIHATESGAFREEILPYEIEETTYDPAGNDLVTRRRTVEHDEGPRPSTMESVSGLRTAFAARGTVTAANSSQMSDGAAAVLLMSERALRELDVTPLARFLGYSVVGVEPAVMGIGPKEAIPLVLNQTDMHLDDIDWIEINEAFAAQTVACIQELGLDPAKLNPNGGAIALGHPLGATGAIRVCTLLHGMKQRGMKHGIVSMCVGTGMGAAGVFEMV
jgi:acetyl-CoA acyltransferase